MKYLSKGRQATNEMNKLAYRLLDEAASLSHTKAMELIGKFLNTIFYLFWRFLNESQLHFFQSAKQKNRVLIALR